MKLQFSDEERAFWKRVDEVFDAAAEKAVAEGKIENKYQFTMAIESDPTDPEALALAQMREVGLKMADAARRHADAIFEHAVLNLPPSSASPSSGPR